jgi:succinate dehydrogenase/fumarate reductase flavoprotein subunit
VIDDACATTVPGLFAAGDAASRENMVGATSGGGGPNATWAMASGVWSGRGAADFARGVGHAQARRIIAPLGRTGLRPSETPDAAITAADLIAAVQQDILPVGKTFFRSDAPLRAAQVRLDGLWSAARAHLDAQSAPPAEIVRAREAAAMIATARWLVASAIARRETRGLNRRLDFPQADPAQACRLHVGGFDQVFVRQATAARALAS